MQRIVSLKAEGAVELASQSISRAQMNETTPLNTGKRYAAMVCAMMQRAVSGMGSMWHDNDDTLPLV
jgi:hypothetical protein